MASYTSHYNLKKPAMGETINITDINGNMDTLDTELYSVSQEASKGGATYVSCSSITAVQNHLLTKYTDMEERDAVLVAIKTTFTNDYFDVNSYWEGHMYCLDKTGNGYFSAVLTNYSSANQVVISYANGTWSYNSIHSVKNLISAEATARTNADTSINQTLLTKPGYLNLTDDTEITTGTLTDFQTKIKAFADTMPIHSVAFKCVYFTTNFIPNMNHAGRWIVKINKQQKEYFNLILEYSAGYNAEKVSPICMEYENGTWYYDRLALKSELDATNTALSTLDAKTKSAIKYINDTSKTGFAHIQADFANIDNHTIQFYSIRPSDNNLVGYLVRFNQGYGDGIFTDIVTGKTYRINNVNGTWSMDEIALKNELSVSTPSVTKGSTITGSSYVNARRCASVVTISADVTTNTTATGYVTIATCEKHPHTNEYIAWIDTQGNTKMGRLTSGGELQIHNPANSTNYMATITFVATN